MGYFKANYLNQSCYNVIMTSTFHFLLYRPHQLIISRFYRGGVAICLSQQLQKIFNALIRSLIVVLIHYAVLCMLCTHLISPGMDSDKAQNGQKSNKRLSDESEILLVYLLL